MQVACCPVRSSWSIESALQFRRTPAIFQPRQGWQHFASNTVEELHCARHCPHCHRRSVLYFVPRKDRSCVAPLRDSLSSHPSLSECCSFVVSSSLPLSGVAVHSTALATTGQHARLQGCLGGVGLPSRAPSPGYAGREAHACQRMCSRGIWISERSITSMAVVWRSWWRGCHCLVGPSWPTTTLVFSVGRC